LLRVTACFGPGDERRENKTREVEKSKPSRGAVNSVNHNHRIGRPSVPRPSKKKTRKKIGEVQSSGLTAIGNPRIAKKQERQKTARSENPERAVKV